MIVDFRLVKDALLDASTDISGWLQLAERQRTEIPNADYCPYAPTDCGMNESRRVIEQIGEAIRLIHDWEQNE